MAHKSAYNSNSTVISFAFVGFLIILIIIILKPLCSEEESSDNFVFNNSQYQYGNPNVRRQYDYYKCVANECGGKTHDYPCLSICHLKTFRKGMEEPDIQDLVCQSHFSDPKAYYNCLSNVYSDYRYP